MTWKCVVMVPVEHTIEFANNIGAARRGALELAKQHKSFKSASGQEYGPKLMEITGPEDQIEAWAKLNRPKVVVEPDDDKPTPPPIGSGSDGPRAA